MGAQNGSPVSRRALWSAAEAAPTALPPPWTDAATLAAECTKCGACVSACPEHVLVLGAHGLPEVDFHRAACTFCGACAGACKANVFDRARTVPWHISAHVNPTCLAARRVVCQSCRDACPAGAIKFHPLRGGVSLPGVRASQCTGCGACVGVCPADAIELREPVHGS